MIKENLIQGLYTLFPTQNQRVVGFDRKNHNAESRGFCVTSHLSDSAYAHLVLGVNSSLNDVSKSLNPLKGGVRLGITKGTIIGVMEGDTRSLDYSCFEDPVRMTGVVRSKGA